MIRGGLKDIGLSSALLCESRKDEKEHDLWNLLGDFEDFKVIVGGERGFKVTSAYGNNFHSADKVDAGQFAFTAVEAGDYMTCFWSAEHNPPVTMTVDFDWKTGVAAKDWGSVAKKGSIDLMELELKKLMDTVNSIHEEMFYLRDSCPENSVDISGSAFEASLNDSLSQLLTNASSVGFSNVTQGSGENQVYALFYCKGDIDLETCRDCVEAATSKIKDSCKFSKKGIIWFEDCTLRYANQTIFSIEELNPNHLYYNRSSTVSEYHLDPYTKTFDATMAALIQQAAYGKGSLPGFATKEVNLSSTKIIRGVAQCTPDIVGPGCERCLTAALRIRDTWANTIMFLPSCFLRYDLYETGEPSVPSTPPPTRRGSYIALIVALSVAFIVLAVIGCAWLLIKKRPLWRGNVLKRRDINTPSVRPITLVDIKHRAQGLQKYTYSQVKQMTKDFAVEVGRGGYGVVYRGLDYLHYHSNDLVVHRDVKPANILLNGDFQAKLADFGSCKIFPKDVTTVKTQVISTLGYTDPGYFQTGLLNMRADVYSFGIVLVELIKGKAPSTEFNLVKLFENALSEGDLDKILDPRITRDLEDSSVWKAIEIALECVKTDETERPDMSEVVATLKKCLDTGVRRNAGNSNRASTSMGILNAMNSHSISMVPDPR
ncbi:hypothetical protein KSS87_001111 [Heliosperma pusillum]|nr:hypothetical protein KSS87_001111 [Heliosperma pusillum]